MTTPTLDAAAEGAVSDLAADRFHRRPVLRPGLRGSRGAAVARNGVSGEFRLLSR